MAAALKEKVIEALKSAGIKDVAVVLLEDGPNVIFSDKEGNFVNLTENEMEELLK